MVKCAQDRGVGEEIKYGYRNINTLCYKFG